MTQPLSELRVRPRALFADVDGTMTTAGRLEAATYAALAAVADAGIPVVVVTGRPAGWGEAFARLWPIAGAIAENGAVTFWTDGARVQRSYAIDDDDIPGLRERMHAAVAEARRAVPGARLSSDCAYREIDLAIDWNEDVSLPVADADRITELLCARGFNATRSSVHVNFGPRGVDKLTACRELVEHRLAADPSDLAPYVYVGDALNDAPLFSGFPHAVGVANVRDVWDQLPAHPAFVTAAREGAGFRELAARLLELAKS